MLYHHVSICDISTVKSKNFRIHVLALKISLHFMVNHEHFVPQTFCAIQYVNLCHCTCTLQCVCTELQLQYDDCITCRLRLDFEVNVIQNNSCGHVNVIDYHIGKMSN